MSETTRLPILDDDAVAAHAAALGVDKKFFGLNVWRTMLANPTVMKPIYDFTNGLLFRGNLDARVRELIILRLGWKTKSAYEWGQHWIMALRVGIPADDAAAVRDWRAAACFSPLEQAVLAAVDSMVDDGTIDDTTWSDLRAHFAGDAEIIELIVVIANWRMMSSVLRAIDVPLDPVLEFWAPDGLAP